MKILITFVLIVAFLGGLWGPAWYIAKKLTKGGDTHAMRSLRVIFPSQLIAVVLLAFLADAVGLRNPAGLLVTIVCSVSLTGAGALFIFRVFVAIGR